MERRFRHVCVALSAVLTLAGAGDGLAQSVAPNVPQRIASMNQCTDVLLLHLVEPARIASVSFVTRQRVWTPPEFSAVVAGLHRNRGRAEEILPLHPDLVVTGAFSSTGAAETLQRLGYRVEVFAPDSTLAEARASILRMGDLVGARPRAEALVDQLDRRLASLGGGGPGRASPTQRGELTPTLADVGVNGWMSGRGTLMADLASAAGLRTIGMKANDTGYRFRSMEEIIAARPDVLAFINAWSRTESLGSIVLRHPAYRRLLAGSAQEVDLPERLVACASPDLAIAAERLSGAARRAAAR